MVCQLSVIRAFAGRNSLIAPGEPVVRRDVQHAVIEALDGASEWLPPCTWGMSLPLQVQRSAVRLGWWFATLGGVWTLLP